MRDKKFILFFVLFAGLIFSGPVYAKIGILTTQQVGSMLQTQKNIIVIDTRNKQNYLAGHLPNAVNLTENQIIAPKEGELGLMPYNQQLEKIFSEYGLKSNAAYIVYSGEDYNNPANFIAKAAWVISALYWSGIRDIYYMDGGFEKWKSEKFPVVKGNYSLPKSHFIIKFNPSNILAQKGFLLWSINNENTMQIIDSRPRKEYLEGHIKGAKWLYAGDFLEKVSNYWVIRPKSVIENLFTKEDIDINKPTVSYCQSGHLSSVIWLIATSIFDKQSFWSFCGTFANLQKQNKIPINIGPIC
ncbi:Thiosulfate sulfurtransferase, rhodanese [Desulfurella amilsii]|uniref:Thiosulfate sulfurtransferase, rhodanese n=1 Tax=Desulfurella amilsii TaxID=1562698 RepID=A0A1X4XY66_9BACT|nr:rhodanese-like domain-containing protein [Desulfurella amilsii]OSS42454.1 Thiosulfate sulfurtransferase, rhodanese [Desulfurella amilsii]